MTGKKFSAKNLFLHDFRRVFSDNLGFTLIGLAVFLILIPFATAGISGNSIFEAATTHDQMKFRFINEDFVNAVYFGILLLGASQGLALFRFLWDKKSVTFLFSLGLKRTKLFLTRALTGEITILLVTGLPMLVSYVLNIKALGFYPGEMSCCLFVEAGLFLTGSAAFVLSVIAAAFAGVMSEALLYTSFFLAAPSGALYCANRALNHLVWGSAYGATLYTGASAGEKNLLDLTSSWNPALFFKDYAADYSIFRRGLTSAAAATFSWSIIWKWTAAVILLFCLACLSARHRKAENAGISGLNPFMTEITAVTGAFLAFSLVYTLLDNNGRAPALFMALAAGAFVCFLSPKGIRGRGGAKLNMVFAGAGRLLAAAAIFAALVVIGNARESALPRMADISSVSLSYTGAPSLVSTQTEGSSDGSSYYMISSFSFSSGEDVSRALAIHENLRNMGRAKLAADEKNFGNTVVPYDILIRYTLKDGTEKTWYYDRASLTILESMLSEDESDDVRSGIRDVVTGSVPTGTSINWASKAFASGDVYLSDIWYDKPYHLALSGTAREELLNALAEDILNQSVEERYFPDKQAKGVFMFTNNGETDSKSFSYHLGSAFVYVTDDFTNTLTFLEKNNLSYCMDFTGEIESVTIRKYNPYAGINGRKSPISNYFMSYAADSPDNFLTQEDFGSAKTITDAAKIAEYLPLARSDYYMSREGYLIAVKLKGSAKYVYQYLPGKLDLTK